MYILSQILVVIADILFVSSMFSKKKVWLVLLLFVSDIVFASHYLCLDGGLTGATTIFIDAIYLIVIFLLEKNNKTKNNLIPTVIAITLTITFGVITWQGAISLLPIFSMLIYLTGMIFTNLIFVKGGAMIRNLLNTIYMFAIASYVGASLELCLMMSALVGIILTIKNNKGQKRKDESNEETTNNQLQQ